MDRRDFLMRGAGVAAGLGFAGPAMAQSRSDTLRIVAESAPNSRDPHGDGVNVPSLGTITNVYDRLVNFDRMEVSPSVYRYDYSRLIGELAERWEEADGGKSLIFHLRRDATFHDGRPVTADDVKWSLDRAVTLPASRRQMSTGSMTDPAQFVVVDRYTFRIDCPRKDRYTLPNLALSFASVLNAELAKKHATQADPWATEWMRNNAAGGGAYRIENWTAGQQIVYARFDHWKSGPLPHIRRAVFRVVPAATARVASLEKGDSDIALQLPPKDIDAISTDSKVRVASIPVATSFRFVAFNTQAKPFDDVRVRQAISYALPYQAMFDGAVFGHGMPLYNGPSFEPSTSNFPQPMPYHLHLQKARELMIDAGLERGFETTFGFNVGDATQGEPIALLVQEGLAAIGIKVTIEKYTAAQWSTALTEKKVPFYTESSAAWFNDPDYFFRIFFQGDWRWNFGSFVNADLAAILDQARWETEKLVYDRLMRQAIAIVFREVPVSLLWLPSFEVAMQPDVTNFTYYIHGQVDLRPITRVS